MRNHIFLFAILVFGLLFTACSDDDNIVAVGETDVEIYLVQGFIDAEAQVTIGNDVAYHNDSMTACCPFSGPQDTFNITLERGIHHIEIKWSEDSVEYTDSFEIEITGTDKRWLLIFVDNGELSYEIRDTQPMWA